jgi:hypothetical protein
VLLPLRGVPARGVRGLKEAESGHTLTPEGRVCEVS